MLNYLSRIIELIFSLPAQVSQLKLLIFHVGYFYFLNSGERKIKLN